MRNIAAVCSTLAVAASLLTACGGGEDAESATMRPGADCNGCHSSFTAAGTIYADASGAQGLSGATVQIVDSNSRSVSLTTNEAGNFFTSTSLRTPLTVTVSRGASSSTMNGASGACNACHNGTTGTGRIFP